MGYFKNELISEQVELGDRLPAPKPASDHVAEQSWQRSRQMSLRVERYHKWLRVRSLLIVGFVGFAAGALTIVAIILMGGS